MIEDFIKVFFTQRIYTWPKVLTYILTGFLSGLVRLTIRNHSKVKFRSWLNDGSLIGGLIISIAGALLFDNSFIWSFLGGYFLVYVLDYIESVLKSEEVEDDK